MCNENKKSRKRAAAALGLTFLFVMGSGPIYRAGAESAKPVMVEPSEILPESIVNVRLDGFTAEADADGAFSVGAAYTLDGTAGVLPCGGHSTIRKPAIS